MTQGDLPQDTRYFRAIAGDEGVSLEPSVRSPTNRGPRASSPRGVVDGEGNYRNRGREITRTIDNERYTLDAESFFQTNIDLVPALIDSALDDIHGETAVELYCGVGLFTVPLARRFKSVRAVEDDADASEFARRNLSNAGLSNAEVVNRDVANWLEDGEIQSAVKPGAVQIDFLLLDPPRTGAESRVIAGILNFKPRRICYVSCDPATLARDLKKLIAGGYSINSIRAFDMFPQTHHVETVVHLIT